MDKFRKTHRHHRKERLAISKTTKFESDLLKTSEYTAPQSREILQTFVCWDKLEIRHFHVVVVQ